MNLVRFDGVRSADPPTSSGTKFAELVHEAMIIILLIGIRAMVIIRMHTNNNTRNTNKY